MSEVKKKEAIERTSRLLLSGWKMLAISCPVCNTALMESKVGEKQCPSCNLPVVMEKDAPTSQEITSVSSTAASEKVVPQKQTYDEMRAEYEKSNKRRNEISSLIGQKLLMGWTMLENSCPDMEKCGGAPLMRERADLPAKCLCCERSFNISHGVVTPICSEGTVGTSNNTNDGSSLPVVKSIQSKDQMLWEDEQPIVKLDKVFESHNNDPSYKISQKLLQGWALLDKTCFSSKCNGETPLLRDKNGKLFCVNCGYIEGVKDVNVSAPAKDDTDDELDELESSILIDSLVQKAMLNPSASIDKPVVRQLISGSKIVNKGHEDNKKNENAVEAMVLEAEAILIQKLLSTAKILEAEDSVQAAGNMADLIGKLAAATAAVRSIHGLK